MKLVLVITLSLSYFHLIGQALIPIRYNKFLPIENTSGCYQDQQGYFWFYSFGHGLVCFDGTETQSYSPNQPKPYRVIVPNAGIDIKATHEQKTGDIWRIFQQYQKGSPSHLIFFQDRKVSITTTFEGAEHFKSNRPYPTFKSHRNNNLYQICPTTAIQSKDTTQLNDTLVIECIYKNSDTTSPHQSFLAVKNDLFLHLNRDKDQKLVSINWLNINKKTSKPALEFQQWLGTVTHFFISNNNSTWYIHQQQTNNRHYSYRYNPYNQKLTPLDSLYHRENKSILQYLFNNQYYEIDPSFETSNYSRINTYDTTKKATYWLDIQSKQGWENYYLSPFSDKILWRASGLGLTKYYTWIIGFQPNSCNNIPKSIFAIHEDHQHRVLFGSYDEGMHYWQEGSLTVQQALDSLQAYNYLGGSRTLFNGQLWFTLEGDDGILVLDTSGQFKQILPNTAINYFIYQSPYDSTIALGSHIKGLYLYKDSVGKSVENWDDWQLIPERRLKTYNVLTTVQDPYQRWWGGRTSTGIFCYDSQKDTVYNWLLKDGKGLGLMSTAQDSNHNLWFGTNRGLFFYDLQHYKNDLPDTSNWEAIGAEYFDNTVITTIYNYKDSLLFIGDQKGGFGVLNLQDFYANPRKINVHFWDFRALYGIKMIEQNIFTMEKERYLWLSNPTMLMRIDVPNIDFTRDSIELQLEQIIAYHDGILDSISIIHKNNITLAAKHRELLFDARYLSFMMEPYDGFYWTIKNKSNGQIISKAQTKTPEFKYIFQGYGAYEVELQVKQRNKILKSQQLNFYIEATWLEPFITKVSIVAFFFLLIIFMLLYRNRREKQLLELRNENSELFIQAIANTTNSHFISNALNYAQTLTTNPTMRRLIGHLGMNIRTLFKLSVQQQIAHKLVDEMQLVENLIAIQQIQYNNTFKRYIPPNPALIRRYRNLRLPVGSLLTHVENAVNHGIRHRPIGYHGSLKIKLLNHIKEDYIHFIIEDNGIGRERAQQIHSHNTKQGLIKQKKIYTKYNKFNDLKLNLWFEDLITDQGLAKGTRVHVQIPIRYNYEFRKD